MIAKNRRKLPRIVVNAWRASQTEQELTFSLYLFYLIYLISARIKDFMRFIVQIFLKTKKLNQCSTQYSCILFIFEFKNYFKNFK